MSEIDRNKVVFVQLGSGSYVKDNGYGHEMFNFEPDEGKFYGYCPPYGCCKIDKIAKDEIQEDEDGWRFIDNVLVIFTKTRAKKGRVIAGYYKNARVYAGRMERKSPIRYIPEEKDYAPYSLVCDVENGREIEYDDKAPFIPRVKKKGDGGHGQHLMWWGKSENARPIREKMIDYVQNLILATENTPPPILIIDEEKFNENRQYVQNRTVNKRSAEARQKCLDIHGYVCKICGFDFEKVYGNIGKGFIEVHHLESVKTLTETNPKTDLMPVCSNCHSMLHGTRPQRTPEEVGAKLRMPH
ncbi:MAG: HNH endonuclease [Chitinispirillales bacterium]|jgi:5-methylcytosine-specific restriction protein A|nr:HNH endonuclease [Chitinispirillales bacterium]